MWVMVMYDLPSASRGARRHYNVFRKFLLGKGFEMRQKSIYLRWEDTPSAAEAVSLAVKARAPAEGRVSVLRLSARSMSNLQIVVDHKAETTPIAPDEFLIC